MLQVGLTGNIGSGKTTVCHFFEVLGVPVYYADQRARQITNTPQVLGHIHQAFGAEVFDRPNILNRQKLAQVVFNDQEALKTLNGFIHPRVYRDYQQWLELHSQAAYCLQEAAIIFESGNEGRFDQVIVVSAPRDIRLQRVTTREKVDRHHVEQRMNNQMDQQTLEEKADYVIVNDDHHAIIPQVLKLHALLGGESFHLHNKEF
ncbi:MAG: dephospho-CoA kinase [Bacteroidales bacterium]